MPQQSKPVRNKCMVCFVYIPSTGFLLRKYDIDFAPIVGGRSAFIRPVRRVVQMIRDLRRPAASEIAIEQIALDWLAKTRGATGVVNFPAWSEVECTPHRIIDSSCIRRLLLKGLDVPVSCGDHLFNLAGFLVNWIQSAHCVLLCETG